MLGSVKLGDENYKKLDSLLRFYGTEITAHSSIIYALIFAFVVYLYSRFIHIWNKLTIPDWLFLLFFFGFGVFLLGRLLYYTELSQTTMRFMGLCQLNEEDAKMRQDLLKRKEQGLSIMIADELSNRLMLRFFGEVENEDFDKIARNNEMSFPKAFLITISNIYQARYFRIMKAYLCRKLKF